MKSFSILLVVCVAFAYASSLKASISVDNFRYSHGEDLNVDFLIFNPSLEDVTFTVRRLPLEGVSSSMFSFESRTAPSPYYLGRLLKRTVEAHESEIRTLAAGEHLRATINIGDAYHFIERGVYEMSLNTVLEVMVNGEFVSEELTSNVISLFVNDVVPVPSFKESVGPNSISYPGCSSSQKNSISSALSIAQTDAQQAYNVLYNGQCTTDYNTWFGAYQSTRYNTVQNNFKAIVQQLNSNNYAFDCSTCNQPGVYAYVYPFDPKFTVYLCPVFWQAPAGSHQFNSRPGTLSHETSHFKAVAGTDDIQYGEGPCKIMANTNPNNAIQNADSHEFYQECNPKC